MNSISQNVSFLLVFLLWDQNDSYYDHIIHHTRVICLNQITYHIFIFKIGHLIKKWMLKINMQETLISHKRKTQLKGGPKKLPPPPPEVLSTKKAAPWYRQWSRVLGDVNKSEPLWSQLHYEVGSTMKKCKLW